jgi:hypothetical protein
MRRRRRCGSVSRRHKENSSMDPELKAELAARNAEHGTDWYDVLVNDEDAKCHER